MNEAIRDFFLPRLTAWTYPQEFKERLCKGNEKLCAALQIDSNTSQAGVWKNVPNNYQDFEALLKNNGSSLTDFTRRILFTKKDEEAVQAVARKDILARGTVFGAIGFVVGTLFSKTNVGLIAGLLGFELGAGVSAFLATPSPIKRETTIPEENALLYQNDLPIEVRHTLLNEKGSFNPLRVDTLPENDAALINLLTQHKISPSDFINSVTTSSEREKMVAGGPFVGAALGTIVVGALSGGIMTFKASNTATLGRLPLPTALGVIAFTLGASTAMSYLAV